MQFPSPRVTAALCRLLPGLSPFFSPLSPGLLVPLLFLRTSNHKTKTFHPHVGFLSWGAFQLCLLTLPGASFRLWTVRCGFLDSLLVPESLALDLPLGLSTTGSLGAHLAPGAQPQPPWSVSWFGPQTFFLTDFSWHQQDRSNSSGCQQGPLRCALASASSASLVSSKYPDPTSSCLGCSLYLLCFPDLLA